MSKRFIDAQELIDFLEKQKEEQTKKSVKAQAKKNSVHRYIAEAHFAFLENLCELIKLAGTKEEMDAGTLEDWYINSIDNTIPPIWTTEHIEELLNDFYVLPREEVTE